MLHPSYFLQMMHIAIIPSFVAYGRKEQRITGVIKQDT